MLEQRSYTGRYVISSSLANTPGAYLGVSGVLEELNAILGTSYTIPAVSSILHSCIAQGLDFGIIYAYLRPYWYDIHTIEHNLRTREKEDTEMRQTVLSYDRITRRDVPPRRVWDLYANRVVPFWVAGRTPWGISHAWVDEKDRANVMTPINGYDWPVPMPKDADLDLIRIEILNLRAEEYAWLDVLCLRQEGGMGEHLRKDEWKLDVPTIGSVYALTPHVVCYFNGLGRPLDLAQMDFKSDRCWFRRAWTLQEITGNPIIGGETGNDVMQNEIRRRLDKQLTSLREIRSSRRMFDLVFEMQHRVSTKASDKVAGLVYLLETQSIPIYDAEQSEEDAWDVLIDVMGSERRAQLLFFYPGPGNRRKFWRPSWEQVMTNKIIAPRPPYNLGRVHRTHNSHADYYEGYEGYHIELGIVGGLSEVSKERKCRQGELVLKDTTWAPRKLKIVAPHGYPIPDGLYTLICSVSFWVVGQLRKDGKFKKVSVIRLADGEKVKRGFEPVEIFLC